MPINLLLAIHRPDQGGTQNRQARCRNLAHGK